MRQGGAPDVSVPGRARRARTWAGVLAVVLLVVAGAVWAGTRATEPSPQAQAPASDTATVTFAAVGDSLTEADSADFANGDVGGQSWVGHAQAGGLEFAGGWAQWGAPTSLMAANVRPVDADVLVVLAGTNDLAMGVPFEQTAANIAAIVEASGVDRVIVSAVPPVDRDPAQFGFDASHTPEAYNERLEAFVRERGWTWTDAAAGLRDGDRFLPGMSYDGVHPTEAGARVLGEAFRAALLGGG